MDRQISPQRKRLWACSDVLEQVAHKYWSQGNTVMAKKCFKRMDYVEWLQMEVK